jgi:phage gpG-like protein
MGTTLPYAMYHQVGPRTIRVFGRGTATLPQRKVIDITAADRARWAAILQSCLMGRAGAAAAVSTAML